MEPRSIVHESILENLLDGVMAVDLDGRIRTFNAAASRMFGLARDDVVGKTLIDAFIAVEGFDEFSQAILDAIAEPAATDRKVVELSLGDTQRSLTITTSYLTRPGDDEKAGVIAVFSDISEVKELREAELRLARALEDQHVELQKAYREVEESNQQLTSVLKKVQVARVAATVFVIALFVGAGAWNWGLTGLFDRFGGSGPAPAAATGAPLELRTVTVRPRAFSSTISLIGRLAPWRKVRIASPVEGQIKTVHFEYGQQVAEGDRLVELDLGEARLDLQDRQVELEKARRALEDIGNWESGSEVSGALRAFSKAKMALEAEKNRLATSTFLLEQGLIPASQHADRKRQYDGQVLDLEAAAQNLAAARAKGDADAKRVAELEFEKARNKVSALEEQLRMDTVMAPLTGEVLLPRRDQRRVSAGEEVTKGQLLLTIADFRRIAVVTPVDEVEVTKIRKGQPVTVRGDAFPGLELSGQVTNVSTQPMPAATRGPPRFEVTVTLDPVEPERRGLLRAGMSSRLTIVTYRNPSALMVPIDAVERRGGKARLRVLDRKTGAVEDREVATGLTAPRAIEITSGLRAGEDVVLPSG